jgi:hypothetical protein
MNRHSSAASLALAVLAVLGLAGPALAQQQVPFKGGLNGVVTVGKPTPQGLPALVNATGNATHLGQFTLAIPHLVTRANGPANGGTAVGTYQFVAANGDRLTASFNGQAKPTSTPGVLAIVETATITGGTGRFAGATGSFTCMRLYDMVAGKTTGSFAGTISAPGP